MLPDENLGSKARPALQDVPAGVEQIDFVLVENAIAVRTTGSIAGVARAGIRLDRLEGAARSSVQVSDCSNGRRRYNCGVLA